MEHPMERYYKLNRYLLSISGLWPYQNAWYARLMWVIFTLVIVPSIFSQLASCFTSDITLEFLADLIPTVMATFINMSNLYIHIVKLDKFKELFECMWKHWKLQKTDDEIKIMHEHAEITRLFTLGYLLLLYLSIMGYNIWMFTPEILDVISPLNESRPRTDPFKFEFFIDKERYFYFIRSHICLVLVLLPIVFCANCTLFLLLTQHACGMCELLRYRAERLFCIIEDATKCNLIHMTKIRNRGNITAFIRLHYDIIQFVDIIETCHATAFLVDLTIVIFMCSFTLMQALTIDGGVEQAIRSIGLSFAMLCYIFILNYMGQRITDLSSSVCDKLYASAWYDAVISEQKSLLLIMKRRFHPLVLTASKFYTLSLQNFGMVLKTIISYCMFIRQV